MTFHCEIKNADMALTKPRMLCLAKENDLSSCDNLVGNCTLFEAESQKRKAPGPSGGKDEFKLAFYSRGIHELYVSRNVRSETVWGLLKEKLHYSKNG